MAVSLSAFRAGRPLHPDISARGRVDPRAIVRLEGLDKLKKIHTIGARICDITACCIVPQLTTTSRAPIIKIISNRIYKI
jgi:hypothetical protein